MNANESRNYRDPIQLQEMTLTMSDSQIAQRFGITARSVWDWRRRFNLPSFTPSKPDFKNPDILSEFLKTMGDSQIASLFGVDPKTIKWWRVKFGLAKSTVRNRGNRVYKVNQSFFEVIDTPEKAYILGLIFSDGWVRSNGRAVGISLQVSDRAIFNAINTAMESNYPIKISHKKTGFSPDHAMATLEIGSINLVRQLRNLGVLPDKSKSAAYPSIDQSADRDFIRGLFDGDGSIGRQFFLCGTGALMRSVQERIEFHTGHRLVLDWIRQARLRGNRPHAGVLHWLYQGTSLVLLRKEEAYHKFWNRTPGYKSLNLPPESADL